MSPLVFGPLLDAGQFQAALVAVAHAAGRGAAYGNTHRYCGPQQRGRRVTPLQSQAERQEYEDRARHQQRKRAPAVL